MGPRSIRITADRISTTIVCALLMTGGSAVFFTGYKDLKKSQESINWPTADGIIASSEIAKTTSDDGTAYDANVRYNYVVGKYSYSSNQVSFGQYGNSGLEHAQSIIRRYEKGQKITVHFNPAHPDESVLEPGVTSGVYENLGMSALLFTAGASLAINFWIVAPMQRRKRTEAIRQLASTIALIFSESDELLQQKDLFRLPLFRRGFSRNIRNILRKDSLDGEVMLFDYKFEESVGEGRVQYHQTVAAFQVHSRSLPMFSLRPEGGFDKFKQFFGQQDIDFESHPEFSKCYLLQGQSEPAIREKFCSHVLQFFSQNPGWWLEGEGKWLAIYHLNCRVDPEKLIAFLEQSTQISELFP